MIVVAVVIGFAVAICVAGWVPVVRDALQVDHVLPGPPARAAAVAAVAAESDDPAPEPEPEPDAVHA